MKQFYWVIVSTNHEQPAYASYDSYDDSVVWSSALCFAEFGLTKEYLEVFATEGKLENYKIVPVSMECNLG